VTPTSADSAPLSWTHRVAKVIVEGASFRRESNVNESSFIAPPQSP
jgi:hypothetical protein